MLKKIRAFIATQLRRIASRLDPPADDPTTQDGGPGNPTRPT